VSQIVPVPRNGALPLGKNRNPLGIWFLNIITCGIYNLYWVRTVNTEIGAHDPSIEVHPGRSMLAQLVPFANFISLYHTAVRVQSMEITDSAEKPLSPILCLLLNPFYYFLVQGHLNVHWDAHRSQVAAPHQHQAPGSLPEASTLTEPAERSRDQVPTIVGQASRPDE
jgi:Domain of unknown function (DUF4234)